MKIVTFIKSEPVAIAGFIQAIVGLVILFGVHITSEQAGGISAVIAAGLALIVRQAVTPVNQAQTNSEFKIEGED